jgi:hypothetical protein
MSGADRGDGAVMTELEVAQRFGVGSPEMLARVGASDDDQSAKAERHWSVGKLTPSHAESDIEREPISE